MKKQVESVFKAAGYKVVGFEDLGPGMLKVSESGFVYDYSSLGRKRISHEIVIHMKVFAEDAVVDEALTIARLLNENFPSLNGIRAEFDGTLIKITAVIEEEV